MKDLGAQFSEGKQISNLKRPLLFDKGQKYLEAVNNQEDYLKIYVVWYF